MSRVKIDRRMYLTADRSRAVPAGDPDADSLLCAAGGEVDRADAVRFGLLAEAPGGGPASGPEAEQPEPEESEPKARTRAPNKARRPTADKGAGAGD